jgi:hypothetical protein
MEEVKDATKVIAPVNNNNNNNNKNDTGLVTSTPPPFPMTAVTSSPDNLSRKV